MLNNEELTLMAMMGVVVLATLVWLSISEAFNLETRTLYESRVGHDSWRGVYFCSLGFGLILGLMTGFFTWKLNPGTYLTIPFANFGTVIGYTFMQSAFTDMAIRKVDRFLLRFGYVDIIALSSYQILSSYSNQLVINSEFTRLGMIYLALLVILFFPLFKGIGASDVRVFALILPFLVVLDKELGLFVFLGTLGLVSLYMMYIQRKYNDDTMPVAIAPFLLFPYAISLPFYVFIMKFLSAWA